MLKINHDKIDKQIIHDDEEFGEYLVIPFTGIEYYINGTGERPVNLQLGTTI